MPFCKVTTLDALWSGEKVGVVVAGRPVLLVNLDGEVHAYEDRCAHQCVLLSGGRLEGDTLVCPAHGWEYDVRTGKGLNPEGVSLRRLPVFLEADDVLVDVPGEGA
jgi:toluene monooxygenase system ferredoxin subunit